MLWGSQEGPTVSQTNDYKKESIMSKSKFEEMVVIAESGQETTCQSFKAGYTAIWYKAQDAQYQVRYEAGEAVSVQIVGTKQVFLPS